MKNKGLFLIAVAALCAGKAYGQCISGNCEDGYGVYIDDNGNLLKSNYILSCENGINVVCAEAICLVIVNISIYDKVKARDVSLTRVRISFDIGGSILFTI